MVQFLGDDYALAVSNMLMLLCSQTNQVFATKKKKRKWRAQTELLFLASKWLLQTISCWGRLPSYRGDDKLQQRRHKRYTNSSDSVKLRWDTTFLGATSALISAIGANVLGL